MTPIQPKPNRPHVFIGDIHGQAPTLLALLEQLGWHKRSGRLQPRNSQYLVFVGDLIDRGPQNLQTVEIVRELVEQGDALCLMGNHELNAVHYHTEHPDQSGKHLRAQGPRNQEQHQAVLDELEQRPGFKNDMLAWFKTLPVAAEGPGWRCVHACWHPASLAVMERKEHLWFLPANAWVAAATKHTPEFNACEALMKGPELELPDGASFIDKGGVERHQARIRWWEPSPATLDDALLFQSPPQGLDVSRPYANSSHPGYPTDAPPVFFGHYWNRGKPEPERPNVACLDYSAGKGGDLVAYRLDDSPQIERNNFVVQPVVQPSP